ncbi:MAG: DUF2183 domain-containing protein [Erythrobacter sp.]|nr:DUF2183 domain-containing protein [Erythrobacter sp.]
MPFGRAPLRVQPFFGFRGEDRLFLMVRALLSHEPEFESRSFIGDLRTMLGEYLSREVPGMAIELEYAECGGETLKHTLTTDEEGYARFEIPLPSRRTLPRQTHWESATLRWGAATGERDGGAVTAHILAPGAEAGLGIISDIDDTIMETGITGNLRAIARNWKRVMVQMPSERLIVPGSQEFLRALSGTASTAEPPGPQSRERPVFYVSSSPWNLFSYLVTFKRQRDLPLGPIMLRDWGFNRRTLGSQGHGFHKLEAVERILDHYPGLRFVLVGDDTQRDIMAFSEVVANRPDRVAAVFIRAVSARPPSEAARSARSIIEQAGIPFWSGASFEEALEFLTKFDIDEGGLGFGRLQQKGRTERCGKSGGD